MKSQSEENKPHLENKSGAKRDLPTGLSAMRRVHEKKSPRSGKHMKNRFKAFTIRAVHAEERKN